VKAAALAEAERRSRPGEHLESPKTSKADLAKSLLARDPLEKPGLVCLFEAVEACMSVEYHRSPKVAARGLKLRPMTCRLPSRLWRRLSGGGLVRVADLTAVSQPGTPSNRVADGRTARSRRD
jgi:hypothetical protein